MASSPDRLSALQYDVLSAFFRAAPVGWFLTGGAALAGFWLKHRTTEDLDLFATEGELAVGISAVYDHVDRSACRDLYVGAK